VVNSDGRLLAFPVAEVPALAKGRGNKLFNIPSVKAAAREELLVATTLVVPAGALKVLCGERHMTLPWGGLQDYRGERAQRGLVLPKNYRRVTGLETEAPAS
jgi:topoisomerase-4 subunit A